MSPRCAAARDYKFTFAYEVIISLLFKAFKASRITQIVNACAIVTEIKTIRHWCGHRGGFKCGLQGTSFRCGWYWFAGWVWSAVFSKSFVTPTQIWGNATTVRTTIRAVGDAIVAITRVTDTTNSGYGAIL